MENIPLNISFNNIRPLFLNILIYLKSVKFKFSSKFYVTIEFHWYKKRGSVKLLSGVNSHLQGDHATTVMTVFTITPIVNVGDCDDHWTSYQTLIDLHLNCLHVVSSSSIV